MGRRSKAKLFSPHSRNTNSPLLRRICIIAAAIIAVLALLLAVGYYQLLAYLQGDSFRQSVSDTARTSLKAGQVELQSNLRINGSRVSTDGINLAHLGQIEMARATGVNVELNRAALLTRKVHLRKLTMEDASLIINTGSKTTSSTSRKKPAAQKNKQNATTRKPDSRKAEDAAPTLDSESLQLDYFECRDTDIHLAHQGQTYQLLGADITATPAPKIARGAWQLNAENARLHTPFSYLRDGSVKSATLIRNGNSLDLTECRIMLSPGEMRTKAHYDTRQHRWTADIQVNKGNPHRLLSEDWKKRLHGELYGRIVLTGSSKGVGTASGNLSLQNGVLEGLPILSQLPMGNTYPYRSIELEKSDCEILYPYRDSKAGEAWLFDKINISAKGGILLVRGHVIVGRNKRLDGTLTIGLPEQIAETLPLPRELLANKLFTASGSEEGYIWVNMNLSGTIDAPQEDLSVRLTTLIGNQLGDIITKGPASLMLDALFRRAPTKETGAEQQETAPAPASTIESAAEAAGSLLQSIF